MPPPQPEPEDRSIKLAKAFMDCLTDESIHYITHLPRDAFDEYQFAALRRISQHCQHLELENIDPTLHDDAPLPSRSGRAPTIEESQPESTHHNTVGAKRGPGRPRKSLSVPSTTTFHSTPWGAITSKEQFKLENSVEEFLRTARPTSTNENAAPFPDALHPSPANPEVQRIPDEKVFSRLCSDVCKMSNRKAMDRVAWLFLVLVVGEMANALFGDRFLSFRDKTDANISMKKMASQLLFVCEELGTGCLFYLEYILSENFLKHRVTQTGGAYEKAMQHVKSVRLREIIEESGANAKGDAIRSSLRIVYKIDQVESRAMDASDSTEGTTNPDDGQGMAGSDHEGGSNDQDVMQS